MHQMLQGNASDVNGDIHECRLPDASFAGPGARALLLEGQRAARDRVEAEPQPRRPAGADR